MTGHEVPPQQRSPADERPFAGGNPWAWPVALTAIVAMSVGGGIYVFKSCRDLPGETLHKSRELAHELGQQLRNVASAFKQGTMTTTFTSYATSLSGSQYLQFATLSQREAFTRTDQSSLLFGYIPLPDVIVEASAPVTYTYYLDLNARWDFVLRDGVIWVTAPDIKYNKPALDISRITYEVKKDSHFRNTSEAMENLRNSMTLMCYQKAAANIGLVRETGRKQTESFVENWLAKSFADGKKYPVKVHFRNEAQSVEGSLPGHDANEVGPGFSR
jgi:hypothetical protein